MNNCAYGSYYGSPIIEGVTVATYTGWAINGILIANSGQWRTYESPIITINAKWDPVTFTAILHDGYSDNYTTNSFNYFDGYTLTTPTRTDYEFRGWLEMDGTLYNGGSILHKTNNLEFTAQWEQIFEVTLTSSMHHSYNRVYRGTMGDTFVLPTLNYNNFHIVKWGDYAVASTYTIMRDAT